MKRKVRPKRGVLLLIVLSLLVLFLLLGTVFLVVAAHYQRAARTLARHDQHRDPPRQLLDWAMYQLLRDTHSAQSSLRHHSLLADLYGNDGFIGSVVDVDAHVDSTTHGQFVAFQFKLLEFQGLPRAADYYNGAIVTMITGRANGLSVRIVQSPEIVGSGATNGVPLITESFVGKGNRPVQPEPGDRFVVNGVPLNGTGYGYNPNSGYLDLSEDHKRRVALLPNFKAYRTPLSVDLGGADESYDAVDMQNMFLAKVAPLGIAAGKSITPSFHRPHLIKYWLAREGDNTSGDDLRELLPRVVMRPTPLEHPNFTGSNPAFVFDPDNSRPFLQALQIGPWDVDNDGNGVSDSVWLDLGLPASAAPDGRLVRPLFAILCTDLDGRLNVNVHGNVAQRTEQYIAPVRPVGVVASNRAVPSPRGLGVGPAEVNLLALFGSDEYDSLLSSRYEDKQQQNSVSLPGVEKVDDRFSRLQTYMLPPDYHYAEQVSMAGTQPTLLHAFASPPDLHGRGTVVLDHAGQPVFLGMGLSREATDDPYELSVVQPNGSDSSFSVSDLERVLRPNDVDSHLLSDRLLRVAPVSLARGAEARRNRRLITTHSFHVPVPAMQSPSPELRRVLGSSWTTVQWVGARLKRNGVPNIDRQLRLMLPFEIRHGQKMNLNRLWSDFRDSARDEFGRNTSVQRSTESAIGMLDSAAAAMPADYRNDDQATAGRFAQTRQMFARHLYCLAMSLLPPGYTDPALRRENIPPDSQLAAEVTARRIAQWAVNVVDFRDPDAIMTPFEYDWNPMDGWQENMDGDLNTAESGQRRVVWGCEYPHLLLTETLAIHDTRLKDSAWDTGESKKRDQNDDGQSNWQQADLGEQTAEVSEPEIEPEDDDLDQFRIPQGSFFAELYCTFDGNNRHPDGTTRIPPPELYTFDIRDRLWKLDLGRIPPEQRRDGGVYPVWRLAITQPHSEADSVLAKLQQHPETTTLQPEAMFYSRPRRLLIDRVIWFTAIRPTPSTFEYGRIYWNYPSPETAPWVAGKHYAVVVPRIKTSIGSQRLPEDHTRSQPSDRFISLSQQAGGNRFDVSVGSPANVQPAIGILAAMPPPDSWRRPQDTAPDGIGISISEPLPSGLPGEEYYPEPKYRIDGSFPITDAYGIERSTSEKLLDTPLDRSEDRPIAKLNVAKGTIENYRSVFLQRLVNPLRAWNPRPGHTHHDPLLPVNPYITVDWMPVDLTIFNGEDSGRPDDWDGHWYWPGEVIRGTRFSTRQRGNGIHARKPEVFAWNIEDLRRIHSAVDHDNYFRKPFAHTLGFLNATYGAWRTDSGHYRGDPERPFPWLTWNDRPFANALELLLVPASSPSRLMIEYTTDNKQSPYTGGANNLRAPFAHLLNFFHGARRGATSPNLCRLLELVEVPSPFLGTRRWYNPRHFIAEAKGNGLAARHQATETFRPPFNYLSRFRDPGRVNLNTIFDPRVWQAMAFGFSGESGFAYWRKLVRSRRAYTQEREDKYPTEYANPFRSALGADLHFELMGGPLEKQSDVEATLLRSSPSDRSEPLFGYQSKSLHDDSEQNPYFRYQLLRRLGNIASTHSNVFAVWITVGYFQIDPQTGKLGQEFGADTGNVNRHRAFYIIDRSIPVAFQPGRNYNVDRAVMLRRMIE